LRALDEHERTFPRGRLVEERQALRVQALVKAGRFDDARRSARRFHDAFPGSFLAPAVDAALLEIPPDGVRNR
jgi:outer membrane protein assembly factor BamD (BamD/ComL family)